MAGGRAPAAQGMAAAVAQKMKGPRADLMNWTARGMSCIIWRCWLSHGFAKPGPLNEPSSSHECAANAAKTKPELVVNILDC